MTTFYKPNRIAERAIIASDMPGGNPYPLLSGAVNLFDLGSGSITVEMPASPEANDTVTLKNARGQYLGTGGANLLTINANGNELEVPGLHDTASFVGPTSSVSTSHPRFAVRWIFLPGTPQGTWIVDQDYDAGAAVTRVSADYVIHPSELVIVDTTVSDVTITIPEGLPDDSWFSVVKDSADQNLVSIKTSGTETIWPLTPWIRSAGTASSLVYRAESVTYIVTGGVWRPVNSSVVEYFEIYYLPVTPVTLTPGQSLLDIALHPYFDRSLLFDQNTGGLLRVHTDITADILLAIDIQAVFLHVLAANNADTWARVAPVFSGASGNDLIVPIDTAFAHSRAGTYGDTRQSSSIAQVTGGETVGIYGEEVTSASAYTDLDGLLVTFRV